MRAIKYIEEGHTLAQAAAVFKVNIGTLISWRKRYRATGDVKIKVRCPVNKKIIPENLIKYVEEHPDAYLKEIAEVFGCHPSSVRSGCESLVSRKKRVPFTKKKPPNKRMHI